MARGESPDRVKKPRKVLACTTCGAGNRLSPSMVERGFQRCGHCESAISVEGAGSFAVENRGARFTRVVSPGKSIFRIHPIEMLDLPFLILFLLGGDVVSQVLRHLLSHFGLPKAVAWAPVVLFVACALVISFFTFSSQMMLVTQNRVETWIPFVGQRFRHRRFGTHGLQLRTLRGRFKALRLEPSRGKPVDLRMSSETAINTLTCELEQALQEARVSAAPDAVACPGCGASVGYTMELLRERGTECGHCGAGVVATKAGAVLGEADLSFTLGVELLDDLPAVQSRRLARASEWTLRPELFVRPGFALPVLVLGIVGGGGSAALGVGAVVLTAPWRALGLVFALIFVPLGLFFPVQAILCVFGRHRILLDDTVLLHEVRVGPIRAKRHVIALSRLLRLEVEVSLAYAGLDIKTAVDEFTLDLPYLQGQGAKVAAEVFDAVEECLRDMGRSVKSAKRERIPNAGPSKAER